MNAPDIKMTDDGRPLAVVPPEDKDALGPERLHDTIEDAYRCMMKGGLLLGPADIGYGLFCYRESGLRKMYRLKQRPLWNPAITVGNLNLLPDLMLPLPDETWQFLHEITAKTTIAVIGPKNPRSRMLAKMDPFVREHTSREDSIAVFLRCGTFAEALVKRAALDDVLVVATSGNVSTRGNSYRMEECGPELVDHVDWKLNIGTCLHANDARLATTMIDLRDFGIRRKGVNFAMIDEAARPLREKLQRHSA